jgi:hypothetical protein
MSSRNRQPKSPTISGRGNIENAQLDHRLIYGVFRLALCIAITRLCLIVN